MELQIATELLFAAILCGFCSVTATIGQTKGMNTDILEAYTKCKFDDGLKIVDVEQVVIDGVQSRTVETAKGRKSISRIGSYRVMIKYPKDDYYLANIRPERSFAGDYNEDKQIAIEALTKINDDDSALSQTDKPVMEKINGFEVYKTNRTAFRFDSRISKSNPNGEIDTVGMDLIFSDSDQTITTIYYFNTRKPRGKAPGFGSIDEWLPVRDRFLIKYTRCVNQNLVR